MTGLPPEGSVVNLPLGRYRAIIVRPVGELIELRGWYLDRPLPSASAPAIIETTIRVPAGDITGWTT